jgi:hypothetical protein
MCPEIHAIPAVELPVAMRHLSIEGVCGGANTTFVICSNKDDSAAVNSVWAAGSNAWGLLGVDDVEEGESVSEDDEDGDEDDGAAGGGGGIQARSKFAVVDFRPGSWRSNQGECAAD